MRSFESEGQRLKLVINIIVLALSLYSVSTKEYKLSANSVFEGFIIDVFAPMQKGVVSIKTYAVDIFNYYLMNVSASKENRTLKKNINDLNSEIFHFKEVERENKRLKELLDFGDDIRYKKVLAQIVAWDASSDFSVIRINKGLKQGLKLQSTVVTSSGLVGYIYRLTDNFADILTILDRNNRVDSIVERTRSHGIIEGYISGKCVMKYVERSAPVTLEDTLITSGLGNIYPKGIKVGIVSKIEKESYGITQYIEVKPSVDFSRLEEVIVLIYPGDKTKNIEWNVLNKALPKE